MTHTPASPAPDTPLHQAEQRGVFFTALAGLVALYLVVACYHLAAVPLVDPDEPRYAAAGRTIATEASLARPESILIPVFNGKPRINKPPLFYWLVALSDTLSGGATEASARAPSVALGLVMLLTTVLLGRRVFGAKVALLAGIVLTSTPLFIALSRTCITDMAVSAFMSAALALVMLAVLELAPPRRTTWLAALCLGLAVLTKATPALAVALVVIIARALEPLAGQAVPNANSGALAWRTRPGRLVLVLLAMAVVSSATAAHVQAPWADTVLSRAALGCSVVAVALLAHMAWRAPRGALARMPWGRAFGVALLMGLWWYAALIVIKGLDEFTRLLQFEVAQRLAGSMHREPMDYYIPVVLGAAFPWSIGLPAALAAAWPAAGSRESGAGNPPAAAANAADRFLLAWVLGIVFFFSIPGAKLATYVLPAMPALALLMARLLVRMGDNDPALPAFWKNLTLGLAVLTAVAMVAASCWVRDMPRGWPEFLAAWPIPFRMLVLQFALAVAGAWALVRLQRAVAATLLLAGSVVVLTLLLLPTGATHFLDKRSAKDLCARVLPLVGDCSRFASVGAEIESLSYYLDRTVEEGRRRRIVQRRAGSTGAVDPDEPPATVNEPFDAVVKEEMARPEKVALFIQRRYCARMLGIPNDDFEAMPYDEIAHHIPSYARLLAVSHDLVVITNKRDGP